MKPRPKTNQVWQHRNGNFYRVILLTNVDSDRPEYPETVVYENIDNGKRYSRLLSDWHRSMTFHHYAAESKAEEIEVRFVAEALSDYLTQLGVKPDETPEHGGDSTAETLARVAISALRLPRLPEVSPHWQRVPMPKHYDGPEEHEG